jgi:hypothetical protein
VAWASKSKQGFNGVALMCAGCCASQQIDVGPVKFLLVQVHLHVSQYFAQAWILAQREGQSVSVRRPVIDVDV